MAEAIRKWTFASRSLKQVSQITIIGYDMFSPAQLLAIELIATNAGTYEEIALSADVCVQSLRSWRQQPDFCDAVMVRAHEIFRTTLPGIQSKLFTLAKQGDPVAMRIYFDHLATLEKLRVNAADCNITFTWEVNKSVKIDDVKTADVIPDEHKDTELPTVSLPV